MEIIVKVNGPEGWGDVDTAIVDVDLDLVLRRRELLQMVMSKDKDVYQLVFWDHLNCYSNAGTDADYPLVPDEDQQSFDEDGWVPLRAGADLSELEPVRTDCDLMVVVDTYVYWRTNPKHGDGRLWTDSLTFEEVLKLKEKQDASRGQATG